MACHRSSEVVVETDSQSVQVSSDLSNQRVMSIVQDTHGYIWIATYRGLNRLDGNQVHQYYCNDKPDGLPDDQVRNLHCDQQGRLWVVTKNGVAIYNGMDAFTHVNIPDRTLLPQNIAENSRGEIFLLMTGQVLRYNAADNAFEPLLSNIPFSGYSDNQMFFDSEDNLWIVTQQGAYCYSTVTGRRVLALDQLEHPIEKSIIIESRLWLALRDEGFKIYDIGERRWEEPDPVLTRDDRLKQANVLSLLFIPTANVLLIGTSMGMFDYRINRQELLHQSDLGFPFEEPRFNVDHFMFDRSRNLWYCSSTKGYEVHSNFERSFIADNYLRATFDDVPVTSVAVEGEHRLWIATQPKGLWSYDLKTHHIHQYSSQYLTRLFDDVSQIYYCMFDSRGNLWLCCMPGTVFCFRPEGEELKLVDKYAIELPIVLAETSDHTICVGTYSNSYFTKRAQDNHFEEHYILTNSLSYMANLLQLSDGRTAALVKGQALRMFSLGHTELEPPLIADSAVDRCVERGIFLPSALRQDDEGNLWIGTVSNGLMRYELSSGNLESIPGAPCQDIASIEEDLHGNLWVSTLHGLGCYDPKSRKFSNYYKSDGLNGNEFYDRCSCKLPDGRLVFGGEHGLTIFHPDRISGKSEASIHLEDLRVNNQLVRPSATGPINQTLCLSDVVHLRYDQNNFSISYSALDFGDGLRFSYQYKLEGFNDQWIDAMQSNEAYFSNIPAGDYAFSVRVLSGGQQNVLAERTIPIIISPALWLTWWAKLLYALIGFVLIWYLFASVQRFRLERWTRLQTKREHEHEKRINTMNMSFFANVSHEFRTPLTIIAAPLRQLVDDKSLPAETHDTLTIMQRSVDRMLRLVNQMMDFHKLEDDALRLEVQRLDLVQVINNVLETFKLQAREKNITLTSHGLEEPFVQWVDQDKVEKVIYNLIGNAIKFIPSGSHVVLDFDTITRQDAAARDPRAAELHAERLVEIRVSDDGPGLPENELDKLFDRYFQLSRRQTGVFQWGTGIGLYFCRRLVELHQGLISAANRSDGNTGSVFTVLLPVDDACYADALHLEATPSQAAVYPLSPNAEGNVPADAVVEQEDVNDEDERPSILVVDDDVEIVRYLKTLLGQTYRVRSRFDADGALQAIAKQEPDMILSDVMMPRKDGYELCREIKNDPQICHIPVVLVTAKTTTSDQITGLDCGADAYVSKPFDPTYLLTLIANIFKNRENVRSLLTANTQTSGLADNVLSPQDKAFMDEFYAIMEKELSNPDLDINHITEIMHVSRSKFYYKVKGLTGEKPGNFFRLFKLNRAAELLREGKYNVSEISDITGFSSLSYFSASFKKQFGVAPSEFT